MQLGVGFSSPFCSQWTLSIWIFVSFFCTGRNFDMIPSLLLSVTGFWGSSPFAVNKRVFERLSQGLPFVKPPWMQGCMALPGGREQAGSGTPEEIREGPDSGRMPCLQFPSSNRSSLKRRILWKIAGPKSVSGSVEVRSSELNSLNEIFRQVTQASFLTSQVAMMIYLPWLPGWLGEANERMQAKRFWNSLSVIYIHVYVYKQYTCMKLKYALKTLTAL